MERIRVLIVDDEPPARGRLRRLLSQAGDVVVAGEAASGTEAVEAIRRGGLDLVFLDVRMPDLDGFGVVAAVGPERMPAVVFVTAFEDHALRAFEVHALDYLLKPFDDQRFAATLARARERIRRDRLDGLCTSLRALLDGPAGRTAEDDSDRAAADRLVIRSSGRVVFVDTADVDWIEGAGSYVRLHVGARSYLLRESLKSLEGRLDPERFLRIHRSAMVNAARVQELRPLSHGESRVLLRDGTELKLSRSYRDRLEHLLNA